MLDIRTSHFVPQAAHFVPQASHFVPKAAHCGTCRNDELRQIRKATLLGTVNSLMFVGGPILISLAGAGQAAPLACGLGHHTQPTHQPWKHLPAAPSSHASSSLAG